VKLFGKTFEYRKWNFGVEWNTDGKRKIKHFVTQDDAKAFFDRKRKMLCTPILFRFRPDSTFKQLMGTKLVWRGLNIKVVYLIWAVLFIKLVFTFIKIRNL
jgi:hypothetical protein